MAIYIVKKVEHNVNGAGKLSQYTGTYLSTESEKGNKRKDFIFKSRKAGDQGSVVATLAVGDKVELKITKNGDYFNLAKDDDAIKLIEKATTGTVGSTGTSSGSKGGSGFGGGGFRQEDPERQKSIIRQSSLKTACEFIGHLLVKDVYPKKEITPGFLEMELFRLSKKMEKYCSGEDFDDVASIVPTVKPRGKADEVPFDTEEEAA